MDVFSNIANKAITEIPSLLGKALLGALVFLWIYVIIKVIIAKIEKKIMGEGQELDKNKEKNANFIGKIIFVLLLIFDILITFQVIGFDASIIMGGISLSLWFSMQWTIENFVSGILILTNKKIQIGEFVQFLEPLKIMGIVEEVNLRYTVIRTFDKRRTIIPNCIISKTPIRTLKSEPLLRGDITFLVPRHTPVDILREKFVETINKNKHILYPEQTSMMISSFSSAGIELKGLFFVNPAKKSPMIVARWLRTELFDTMKQFGVKIPYPHLCLTTE